MVSQCFKIAVFVCVRHALLQLCCTANNYCTMFLKPDDMVLANNFEETFGDVCGYGVWSELSKTASSNLNHSVVALASFKGGFLVMCYTISCL